MYKFASFFSITNLNNNFLNAGVDPHYFFLERFYLLMRELSTEICDYINREWISTWEGSVRSFAEEHDIDEKTVRQIANFKTTPFKISLYTLEKMCKARKVSLQSFFKSLDR